MFSGIFIGPTSQAPRIDETRQDSLYELEIAFSQIPEPGQGYCPPWLVDRIFRHILVDVTGNTHRAEFCIDKLYSPDSATGRLGLLELRGFEMPPHARMSLTQQLLVRALVAWFWQRALLAQADRLGYRAARSVHAAPFHRARFRRRDRGSDPRRLPVRGRLVRAALRVPLPGLRPRTTHMGIDLELRQATEPWYVLGEEPGAGGTARYVDSSRGAGPGQSQRAQRRSLRGDLQRPAPARCIPPVRKANGWRAFATAPGSRLPACIPRFPSIRRWSSTSWTPGAGRSVGGCTYHVSHPGGRSYDDLPGQRQRGRGAPRRPLLCLRPHAGTDDACRPRNPIRIFR